MTAISRHRVLPFPRIIVSVFVAVGVVLLSQRTQADLIKLTGGGELRGRIVKNPASGKAPSQHLQIETLTGATVVVNKSDAQFVTMRSLATEEYETKARRILNTLEAQWEMSEWCRQRGLSKQREVHLLKVVELDPHHQKAQSALGRVWNEGAWIDRDDLMASQGYVKYKGRYITTQELEVIQKTASELEQERDWFQKVRLWHGWLIGRHEERSQQGLIALQSIEDQHAAPALIRFLCDDTRRDVRMLGVSILCNISGAKAVAGLVKRTLLDIDPDVRYASLNGIAPDNFEYAQPAFIKELKNENNTIVSRAAAALARVGDERAISPLIDALVTTHRYSVATNELPGQTYTYRTDGSFGSNNVLPPEVEAAMRTGQLPGGAIVLDGAKSANAPKKMVLVRVDHWNQDVLNTLQKLTQRNFGYDERTWHLWWAAEKNAGGADQPAKKK